MRPKKPWKPLSKFPNSDNRISVLDIYARLHVTRIRSFDGIDLMAIVHTLRALHRFDSRFQGKKAILFEERTPKEREGKRKKKKRGGKIK